VCSYEISFLERKRCSIRIFEESHGVSVYNLESKAARTLISAYSRKDYSLEVENL